jgi:hypothetical protein
MTCAALAARSLTITSAEILFWEEGLCPSLPMPHYMSCGTEIFDSILVEPYRKHKIFIK